MIEEINKAIRESLPEKVGKLLREELEEKDKLKELNRILEADAKRNIETLKDRDKRIKHLESLGIQEKVLDEKKANIEKREQELDVKMLTFKNETLTASLNQNNAFVSLLCKNPRAVEMFSQSTSVSPCMGNHDGNGNYIPNTDTNGTRTTEETKD